MVSFARMNPSVTMYVLLNEEMTGLPESYQENKFAMILLRNFDDGDKVLGSD